MSRYSLCAVALVLVLAGLVIAAEATVVSYDKDTMKLVVTEGKKERTLELKKGTHVHDVDGKEVRLKDRPDKLKKGVVIDIEEKDGKLLEINILKK
jgi:hypothetical protein